MWTLHLQQERVGCSLNRFCKQLREARKARGDAGVSTDTGIDTGTGTGTGTGKGMDKDKDTIEVKAAGTASRRGAKQRQR